MENTFETTIVYWGDIGDILGWEETWINVGDPLHCLVWGRCSTATVRFALFGLWDSLNICKKDPFFFPAQCGLSLGV